MPLRWKSLPPHAGICDDCEDGHLKALIAFIGWLQGESWPDDLAVEIPL